MTTRRNLLRALPLLALGATVAPSASAGILSPAPSEKLALLADGSKVRFISLKLGDVFRVFDVRTNQVLDQSGYYEVRGVAVPQDPPEFIGHVGVPAEEVSGYKRSEG